MESLWSKTWEMQKFPALNSSRSTDVAVIGGGMAGILTAYQLEQAGVHTVVLEANRIGGGQTGNTTAKITSQHGLFCSRFIEKKGEETARRYIQANQAAVEEYKRIIRHEQIECDLKEMDAYVYSQDGDKLRRELESAQSLGVRASFVEQIEIPVSCAGAVRFPGQAVFHPLKFISALAEKLTIYEDTPAKEVEENEIRTPCGSLRAEKIIFTSHFPFINYPGMYFARMHQERSYAVALEDAGAINGMYIGDGEDSLSFRPYDKYILLGGQGHRTGENREGGRYERLKEIGEALYPESRITACWSAQDCMTADHIPFIGQYASDRPDWFVATGFNKWGMSSSMVSAMLLRDMICGIANPWAEALLPPGFRQKSSHR